jgi:hypothetical protein
MRLNAPFADGDFGREGSWAERGRRGLSLLKIQSEQDLSRAARIAIESMRLGETGCDLNSRRSTLIEIEKPSDTSILTRRTIVD